MSLEWNEPAVKKMLEKATKKAINRAMAEAVIFFKDNHPGWKNISGTAEGSVRIVDFAEKRAKNEIYGRWGSVGVDYMKYLEVYHGSALRKAGDMVHSRLRSYIREELS